MITLSPSQQHVVEEFPEFLCNEEKEMTISGFAGSGKSFLVKYLADVPEKQQKLIRIVDDSIPMRRVHFTATTNKAAAVLRSMLGDRPVQTIHKLLGLVVYPDFKTGKQVLKHKDRQTTNLDHSIIFIDEASMINEELLAAIRKAQSRYRDCKVIFIGDSYQLPPVKENVCPVFDPNASNVFFLKEIQRQVADSPIIQLSAEYRNVLDNPTVDWPTIPHDGQNIFHYKQKEPFFDAIEAAYTQNHAVDAYKVVAWSNRRVNAYNSWIRKLHGMTDPFHIGEIMITNKPLIASDGKIVASTDTFHIIEDLVPHTIMDIDGFWVYLEGFPQERFFQPTHWNQANALIKELKRIGKEEGEWGDYFKVTQEWADLRPIHASTVHKSQGSTYEEVFVDLNNIGTNTHWQEVARLVYVAITRASSRVHIFGELCMNYNKEIPENMMEGFVDVKRL